jgi:hypothetical protein
MMIDVFKEELGRLSGPSKLRCEWYPTARLEVSTGAEATRGAE